MGWGGLNATQKAILDELRARPLLGADLAARLEKRFGATRNVTRELKHLESERYVFRAPPARKASEKNKPRPWKLVPADAREAAEVAADYMAGWARCPREIFFKETRGAVEETVNRHVIYFMLVHERGFTFEIAGAAMGRHRESVQNGVDIISELYHDETKPEFAQLIDRMSEAINFLIDNGGAYRRAADEGVAAVLAAANENHQEGRANSQGLGA